MTLGQELDEIFYNIRTRITVLENNQEMFSFREDTKNLRSEVGDLNAEAATFATYAQLKKLETELTEQIVRIAAQSNVDDVADKETVLGIEAGLTSQIEMLESELNDRMDRLEEDMGFDPDDLRCDLESQLEEVSDNLAYESDRIDEIEAYKCDESEVESIVERMLDDAICERVTDAVCDEINTRAVGFTEYLTMCDRVKELEDRLNKPSLSGRILRWLREGPSIKEVATNWYAGIRRGS